jgi:hypothetical protein
MTYLYEALLPPLDVAAAAAAAAAAVFAADTAAAGAATAVLRVQFISVRLVCVCFVCNQAPVLCLKQCQMLA